MPGISWHDGFR